MRQVTSLDIFTGVIAGVFMVIFSLLIVKKRSGSGKPSRQTYLEVDEEEITAEDRHIAAMQASTLYRSKINPNLCIAIDDFGSCPLYITRTQV